MKNLILLFLSLAFFSTLFSQENPQIIRVKSSYAVVNRGARDGIEEGDKFKVYTPNNEAEYGEVIVVRRKQSISAVKLLKSAPGYVLKVGDVVDFTDEAIADELLYEPPQQDVRREEIEQKNQKKGFIIGGGLGGGFLSNKTSVGSFSDTQNKTPFLTEFKIGYAPSNRLEIYYVSKTFWWKEDAGFDSFVFVLGLSGVATTVYVSPSGTGFSLSGGLGLTVLAAPFESAVSTDTGFGLFGGVGYEFLRHWSIQAEVLYSHITEASVIDFNSLAFRLTLNGLVY